MRHEIEKELRAFYLHMQQLLVSELGKCLGAHRRRSFSAFVRRPPLLPLSLTKVNPQSTAAEPTTSTTTAMLSSPADRLITWNPETPGWGLSCPVSDLFIDREGGTILGRMSTKAALRSQLVLMLVSRLVGGTSCPPERLVVYKMELQTFWDEQTFPKQYPQVSSIIENR